MITLTGIFSESFGGTCTIRGYAKYTDIIDSSYPHPHYQRPEDPRHIDDISKFITSGTNSFSPEVVLAYTAEYDYYAPNANGEVNAIEDIRSGKGFTSNKNGVVFKKQKAVENGFLYQVKIPDLAESKPFRRVDGNHRLKAFEKLISEGQVRSSYLIPFCIILFADGTLLKDEKIIFHNINSKAIPIKSEQLLKSVVIVSGNETDFSDDELKDKFGFEYLLARKFIKEKPLVVRKLKSIKWVNENLITIVVDLISFINSANESSSEEGRAQKIETAESIEAFFTAVSKALSHATPISANELSIASGIFFLLSLFYYWIELTAFDAEKSYEAYKNNFVDWANKYQVTDVQRDSAENASINAKCIWTIYDKYRDSTEQTIFLSRCFNERYNENEHAIRRAIDEVNREKHVSLKLVRVDQHTDGATDQISDRIFREIQSAGLVIADLSSGRPNIPHEIGYAMGLKKDLIIIHNGTDAEAEEHTPSNIRMYEQVRFDGNYQSLHDQLKTKLIDYYKL